MRTVIATLVLSAAMLAAAAPSQAGNNLYPQDWANEAFSKFGD